MPVRRSLKTDSTTRFSYEIKTRRRPPVQRRRLRRRTARLTADMDAPS